MGIVLEPREASLLDCECLLHPEVVGGVAGAVGVSLEVADQLGDGDGQHGQLHLALVRRPGLHGQRPSSGSGSLHGLHHLLELRVELADGEGVVLRGEVCEPEGGQDLLPPLGRGRDRTGEHQRLLG